MGGGDGAGFSSRRMNREPSTGRDMDPVLFIYFVTASTIVTAEARKPAAISICTQTQNENITHETATCLNPMTHNFTGETRELTDPQQTNA
jgi:hypothetical protein